MKLSNKGRKTYSTAVVIIPPANLWPPIQSIRCHYDKQVRRWMPHINLIYPFRPKEEFEILEKQFSQVCKNVKPFEIELREFRFFQHSKECYTLWLAPEPKEAVIKLQAALWHLMPDCGDLRNRCGSDFVPHLSVGQARSRVSMIKLLDTLQASWHAVTFTVCEISFICRGDPPDDIFQVSHKIKLGGDKVKDL